jgi:hypothetical protein
MRPSSHSDARAPQFRLLLQAPEADEISFGGFVLRGAKRRLRGVQKVALNPSCIIRGW